jgi:hypothetical protein
MKKISPRTAEMLNKQGPAGKLKQVVPLPAHGNNSVASDFVNQLLSGISPNRSVRDKALAEMFALIMMLNEAGLSERYGMLVAGSAAAWLGFLVTEKKYKSGGDYQKYLVNTLDAARNRYVDRLQRKAS